MPRPNAQPAKILEIKKYANRRYYDATHSRHLTLEEIRTLVQQGYDIRVLDARTSADITAQILTQIILELDTSKVAALPVPLLVRLIRMNDELIKDFIEKYFNQALQSFLGYQQQFEEQLRRAHGLPPGLSAVSAWTKAMFEPFAAALGASHTAAQPTPQPAAAAPPLETETGLAPLVRELQKQVQKLQKAAKLKAKSRRKR